MVTAHQPPLSPILAPLSSRPPNNNIISIENKVSSRNFTSCLATLVSSPPPTLQFNLSDSDSEL